jgi:AcrR family transcriptional regulator
MAYYLFVHGTTKVSSTLYDVTRKKSVEPGRGRGAESDTLDETVPATKDHRQPAGESGRGRQASAREIQRETQAARREAQAALREAQRETQTALREAQREAGAAAREMDPTKRASKLERAAANVESAAAKVDAALAAHADKHERMAKRSAEQAAKLDRLASYLGALDVWTRIEPGGRKPRFSRDEIAEVAIRIADEEGLDALSMRHLASELGAGTMTLYHYVRTKDELMTLVNDAVMGEVVVPADESLPAHWRDAVSVIAHRSRAVMQRHPWVLDIADDPPFGPNGVRHFDQSLEAVASLDIDLRGRLDIVAMVDEYVFGHCLYERNNADDGGELFPDPMKEYVRSLLETGDYPQIQALADELGLDETWEQIGAHLRDPGRFERGLQRVLDGIEAGLGPR